MSLLPNGWIDTPFGQFPPRKTGSVLDGESDRGAHDTDPAAGITYPTTDPIPVLEADPDWTNAQATMEHIRVARVCVISDQFALCMPDWRQRVSTNLFEQMNLSSALRNLGVMVDSMRRQGMTEEEIAHAVSVTFKGWRVYWKGHGEITA